MFSIVSGWCHDGVTTVTKICLVTQDHISNVNILWRHLHYSALPRCQMTVVGKQLWHKGQNVCSASLTCSSLEHMLSCLTKLYLFIVLPFYKESISLLAPLTCLSQPAGLAANRNLISPAVCFDGWTGHWLVTTPHHVDRPSPHCPGPAVTASYSPTSPSRLCCLLKCSNRSAHWAVAVQCRIFLYFFLI